MSGDASECGDAAVRALAFDIMHHIRVLPPEIVSRIAAGEVVERPASLVKELVENSIDAHATEIDIDLEEGGKKKVTVRDNGGGMSPEDLPLAFQAHATSKLRVEEASECLFGVASLGFRGEALAAMCAVSDVEAISRPPRQDVAYRYRPGRGEVEPAAGPEGTVIEIRNLFHNVPARRKFLRAATTELSHVLQQVTRLALGFPSIRFRLTHHGRKVLDLAGAADLGERLRQILGPEKAGELVQVAVDGGPDRPALHGFVGSPKLRRGDTRDQHFFVDGRWIRDRLLLHAVRAAYQGFLIPGQQPVCYLFLEFPPGGVDVNVHPMKTEVRFRDPGGIYPLIHHSIRQALEGAGDPSSGPRKSPAAEGSAESSPPPDARPPDHRTAEARRRVERAAGDFFSSPRARAEERRPPLAPAGSRASADPAPRLGPAAPAPRQRPDAPGARRTRALQILGAYILIEEQDGLALIDQHALHEKILFEEILRGLLAGEVIRQKLLVPEIVEIPLDRIVLADSARRLLARCGYEIEPFGDREVAVHAIPMIFDSARGRGDTAEIIREVFRWLQEEGADVCAAEGEHPAGPDATAEPYRRLASLLACKRAVKAGDPLQPEEIDSLLDRADLAEDPRHCPHGRPTMVRLSRRELERRFDRK
ncbi:MAG: DNA mismatch repair endonuclease MutL [Planctomycetes bacterium]|nr:DNA mismatch repair endonuclease MutL [Planctomycetota bacterium]